MPLSNEGDWYSVHESWMESPKNLTKEESFYLYYIESVFRVKNAGDELVSYLLSPHQAWFHIYDYSLCQGNSKIKIVKKSRNTSFTISSLICIILSSIDITNPEIPVVRLNATRAKSIIKELKAIIKNMNMVQTEDGLSPFDINSCNLKASETLEMPNGNVFTAFPANSDASENIRGIRTHFGLLDETNYMRKYRELFTALRKASFGSIDGVEYFQLLIGTTLKGETPFSEELEKLENRAESLVENPYVREVDNFVIFDWPIFDREIFLKSYTGNPEQEIPFHENPELVSLVPWQDKKILWQDYCYDDRMFMEENMAVKVEGDEQFYSMPLIMGRQREFINEDKVDAGLEEGIKMEISIGNFDIIIERYESVLVGVDVASVHDYFVITCFGRTPSGIYEQFYLRYKNKVELEEMEVELMGVLKNLQSCGVKWRCKIDSFGIGLQIYQKMDRTFPSKISGNSAVIKDAGGVGHRLNEYAHTKMKRMMVDKHIWLSDDPFLVKHFAGVNYDFKAVSGKDGHSDICMASIYAIVADEEKAMGEARLNSSSEMKKNNSTNSWLMKEFRKNQVNRSRRKFR